MSVYPFIEAEKVEDRYVTQACELMEVSRSAFYDWVQHQPSRREVSDAELGERIEKIHAKSRGTCGAPRVHAQLRRDGVHVSRKGVARIMAARVWPAAVSGAGRERPSPTLTPRPPSI